MRNLLYISILAISISSCRSIEKMVDKGEYDKAILFAAEKLHGERAPKTKYVMGLEEAFAKVTQRDVDKITYMMKSGREDHWDRIYDMYVKMEERQDRIQAFLPLISKDGYKAEFRFLEVNDLKLKAAREASAYNYNLAVSLLKGGKDDARKALYALRRIDRYFTHYENKESLKDEAKYKGTTRVSVDVLNEANAYIPFEVERQLKNLNVNGLGSTWVEYFTPELGRNDADVKAVIRIRDIYVSPGQTRTNTFIESKEIYIDGDKKIEEKDLIAKDSSIHTVKAGRTKWVEAEVTEVWLEKEAEIRGNLNYYDVLSGRLIKSLPVNALARFEEYGATYIGNKKALSKETKQKLRSIDHIYLPSSEALLVDAGEIMKEEVLRMINREVY
jgi:hypothetical protein